MWVSLSLLTALMAATDAAMAKRFFGDLKAMELAAAPLAYSLPLFLAVWFLSPGPPLSHGYWVLITYFVPIHMVGFLCHLSALKYSPLSLTMPFLSFTPAFTIATGFFILHETPSWWGAAGILLIVAGSYLLNLGSATRRDPLGPFKAMFRERGSVLMLAASVIWAFGVAWGKVIALEASPMRGAATFFLIHNTLLLALLLALRRINLRTILSRPGGGALCGLAMAGHIVCHFHAVALVNASYMVSIKRLSGLISVLYGKFLFKEIDLGNRLGGSAMMAAGAAVIVLMG